MTNVELRMLEEFARGHLDIHSELSIKTGTAMLSLVDEVRRLQAEAKHLTQNVDDMWLGLEQHRAAIDRLIVERNTLTKANEKLEVVARQANRLLNCSCSNSALDVINAEDDLWVALFELRK